MSKATINDDELDAILSKANQRLYRALDRTVDVEAGLRAVVAPRNQAEVRSETVTKQVPPQHTAPHPALRPSAGALTRAGWAIIGVSALVVATFCGALAELNNPAAETSSATASGQHPSIVTPGSGGASPTAQPVPGSQKSLTKAEWKGAVITRTPMQLSDEPYPDGFTIAVGCPASSITTTFEAKYNQLELTVGVPRTGADALHYEIDLDNGVHLDGELTPGAGALHLNVPANGAQQISISARAISATSGACAGTVLGVGDATLFAR
ncbi:hypothetical protein AB0F91_39650 [Amycolatopsis sp. NPDC023774]|uniref:hypothetical protein n=1 Tax=Amycolatopsis sp. NPDC023774 TaxID=3155015 RepID=UPI0033E98A64